MVRQFDFYCSCSILVKKLRKKLFILSIVNIQLNLNIYVKVHKYRIISMEVKRNERFNILIPLIEFINI